MLVEIDTMRISIFRDISVLEYIQVDIIIVYVTYSLIYGLLLIIC